MSLPNVVIAGVNKGGTTSLYSYLARHPAVGASSVKETCYFLPLRYGAEPGPLFEYEAHFADCAERPCRIESTPGYFHGGRSVAEAIARRLEGARIVVVLRDPVERAFSFFKFKKSTLELDRTLDFATYVDRCLSMTPEEKGRRENNRWFGVDGGFYAACLNEWLDVFGERLRVLFFEDLRDRPHALLRDLAVWLGIDPGFFGGDLVLTVENRTVPYRHALLHRAALAVNRAGERLFRARPRLKQRLRGAYQRVNRGREADRLEAPVRERLRQLYASEEAELVAALRRAGVGRPPWLAASAAPQA